MKKSVFSLAIIAALALPMAVSAQEVVNNQDSAQPSEPKQWSNPILNGIELTDQQKEQLEALENPFMFRGPQRPEGREQAQKDGRRPHKGHGKEHGKRGDRRPHHQMGECPNPEQCQSGQCPQMGDKKPQIKPREGFKPQGPTLERKEMMEQMVASRSEYLQKVSKILTPEQYNKFLENMAIYQHMPMAPFRDPNFNPGHQREMCPFKGSKPEEITEGVVVGFGHPKAEKKDKKAKK